MINVRTIRKIQENGGMTLKLGKPIRYKSGWQVAFEGVICKTPEEASKAIRDFGGNCGLWRENGLIYVDRCKRVQTKREALAIGRAHNQISVYGWAGDKLAYCAE